MMNAKVGFALMLFGITIAMGTQLGFGICWAIGLILNFWGLMLIIGAGKKE